MVDDAVPMWIEAHGRPVFGWLHRPRDGRSRGMVVICPPLAREHDASHPALRALAEALVVVGFSAVRFDYYGTGDSGGNGGEDDLVDSWLASIGAVVSYAREVGEQHVTLLGLRMGRDLGRPTGT